jgi:hypothetical protein
MHGRVFALASRVNPEALLIPENSFVAGIAAEIAHGRCGSEVV